MNAKEREQLNGFLSQLVAAHAGPKDVEAEGLIREAVARQPDAAYLLVQKAFVLEQAVAAAQGRIAQLQGELDALRAGPQGRGSFADSGQWGNSAASPAASRMAPPPVNAAPAPVFAPAPAAASPSWASGWLGNVATTAAGVAAGAFLFQGIENLFGHHHGGSGLLGDNAFGSPSETTVVNNFFETSSFNAAPLDDAPSSFAGLSDGLEDSSDDRWI